MITFPQMSLNDPSNHLFQLAVRFVNQTDKHLFLTGKAGTGKTTFLKYIKENAFKRMAIVAPTGVAAINAGGVTIHSFFQLPFGPFVPGHKSGWNQEQRVTNQHTLLKNIRFTSAKRKMIQELEIIIIDEVSMMRCDMLDAIDHVLRHFRKKQHLPFGGVQMIYIGDLFQLPPVINNEEWELLKDHYQSPFFFDAQAIQQSPPLYLELKKIYRQSETSFISLLNNIRNNKATRSDLDHLQTFYRPDFLPAKEDNYIILTSHNNKAESINRRELENLNGKLTSYNGVITGDFSEKALPAEMKLELKKGAQIMFLKNDKGETRRYFNGKIGHISRIEDESVFVKFPGDAEEMEIEKETWKNIRYQFNEEDNEMEEEEIGSFTQYPIRLAWAITIHKSQGLTFEKAIIDAGSSFAAGQVYVALSRLTSLDGLVLYSKIQADSISTDSRVISFTRNAKELEVLQLILQEEQLLFTSRMLIQSFDWTKFVSHLHILIQSYPSRNIPGKESAMIWAKEIMEQVQSQNEIAKKFSKQLHRIISETTDETYTVLHNRTVSAEGYFNQELTKISTSLDKHIREYSTKKRVKSYLNELEYLDKLVVRKRKELINAVEMAENLRNIKETGRASDPNLSQQHTDQNSELRSLSTHLHQ